MEDGLTRWSVYCKSPPDLLSSVSWALTYCAQQSRPYSTLPEISTKFERISHFLSFNILNTETDADIISDFTIFCISICNFNIVLLHLSLVYLDQWACTENVHSCVSKILKFAPCKRLNLIIFSPFKWDFIRWGCPIFEPPKVHSNDTSGSWCFPLLSPADVNDDGIDVAYVTQDTQHACCRHSPEQPSRHVAQMHCIGWIVAFESFPFRLGLTWSSSPRWYSAQ